MTASSNKALGGDSKALERDLEALPPTWRTRLAAAGFDAERLLSLARTLEGDATARRDTRNRMRGDVTPPLAEEILAAPTPGTPESAKLEELGAAAIARGEL